MKAWILPQLGSIDNLTLTEHPDPTPGDGEVVLEMHLAALNPADRYLAEGAYPARPSFPHILGRDGIGKIVAVGANAGEWKIGDEAVLVRSEIGVNRPGTFAERVSVPVESLIKPPAGWSSEQSAGATLVYLTAWQALTQWGDLPPSVVLVTGASGGVGVASIQLGKSMGHTIIAMSRGDSKTQALKDLGADLVVDPNDTQWRKRVKEYLGKQKVDLAIDNIGGETFGELIDTLGMWGRVSVVGRLAGPVPQFNTSTLFFRRIRIGGVAVGTYSPTESQAAWAKVIDTLDRTGARPLVDNVFAFDHLPAAFARLKQGPLGKVLLRVR
jgi:NADPH2:quinone reductase